MFPGEDPEGEIERRLAGFWADLLGIGRIGAEDNFFELGGHSLIAVRLFAKIKAAYSVDFPISVLFEAPTVRACANLIAARVGDQAASVEAVDEDASDSGGDFNYLVQMQSGGIAAKTPFFMVAGMFGNVLNLRHLAHLIGADRPFYGLQARGLDGRTDPGGITDMAADYVAQIRTVQPTGP